MDQSATDMAKQVSLSASDFPRRENGHAPKSEKVVLGEDMAIQVQRRQPSTSKEVSRSCNCSLQQRSLRVLVVDNDQDTAGPVGFGDNGLDQLFAVRRLFGLRQQLRGRVDIQ